MRKIMTNKKDPKDFDFEDSNDFDFDDEILSKDFNKEDELVDPKHLNDDFDFGDEVVRPVGENVIKRQNTITEKEIKDHEEDDFPDYDFGITSTKPTMIRKIDCTSLNEAEKHFVCLALTIRDQTKRKSLLNDQLIRIRFVEGEFEARMDFIADIIKVVVESKRLEANGKKYFFNALKKSMVSLLVELVEEEFEDLDQLINEEIEKNS